MPTPPRSSTKAHSAGYAPDDIFGSQNRCHFAATLTRIFASNAIRGVKRLETTGLQFSRRDTRDRHLACRQPDAQVLRPHTCQFSPTPRDEARMLTRR